MTEFDVKTPMMKQYFDIKAENPGALVMFRLGDFYEFFGEDAQIASKELDIVLTGRDAGMEERMPMCGVPHHALEQYLGRLIQKGYRVCICEQLEDPRSVKGLVKRGVIRVVTPGTAMEAGQEEESVFIAAILHGEGEHWAYALCEVSIGQLRISEFTGPDCLGEMSGEITRLAPKEILVSENDYLILTEYFPLWFGEEKDKGVVTLLPGTAFSREAGLARLEKQFPGGYGSDMADGEIGSTDAFGAAGDITSGISGTAAPNATSKSNGTAPSRSDSMAIGKADPVWLGYPLAGDCAGAILNYLDHTQKAAPAQIRSIEAERSSARLVLDPTTFRNLEITRNLRTYEKKGSLLDLMDKTRTAFGARLLRGWLEKPLVDRSAIEARLDAVESLHQDWSRRQEIRRSLNELYDMERLMTRVVYLRAVPRELQALRQSFEILPHIRKVLSEILTETGASGELYMIHEEIDELNDLFDRLTAALSDDIPNNWKEGGFIRPGYDPQADEYRDSAQNGRTWMLELERRERDNTGIKNLKIGYNKVFGYYFDVTKSNLASVPDHFQRKQTLASGERYVTEELIHLEGMVLGAEEKMTALEMDLYQELLAFLTNSLPRVQITAAALAKLDVFQSLAELAASGQYCRPQFQPAGCSAIRVKDLRHPVVEQIMDQDRFVPNDLAMDEDTSLYIITGPNMGGKSTYCRSVAIAFLMAQTGSFIA
ncbi:MAG: DNA mismatch repair protein MutS, partial [Peptococcaceae bacterium]|nr:DNA mismatch repair protein MutS [Peptococcaceae bacterium]